MSCVSSLGQSSSEDLNSLCAESTDCRAKVFFFFNCVYAVHKQVFKIIFENYFLSNTVQQPLIQHFHCISISNHPETVIVCRRGGCSVVAENFACVWETLSSILSAISSNVNWLLCLCFISGEA